MRRPLYDLAALAARVGVGGIFFANGWHKLEAGLTATGSQFDELGAPAPDVWAAVTMLTELIGGTLLVAGLAVSATGLVLFVEALAVFFFAAGDASRPLTGGDVNLIVALGAAAVLLAVVGAGRISVDHMVVIRRREAEAADEFAAENEADQVIASLRDPDRPSDPAGPTSRFEADAGPGQEAGPRRDTGAGRDTGSVRDTGAGREPDADRTAPHTRPSAPEHRDDLLVAGQSETPDDTKADPPAKAGRGRVRKTPGT